MPNLLQSQLAFFGAIDDAVVDALGGNGDNRDAVLDTVAPLLPGTTGFGQAGWYRELERFAQRPGVRVSALVADVQFPTFAEARTNLERLTAAPQPSAGVTGPGDDDTYSPTGDPALARSAYAAMILHKIADLHGLRPDLAFTAETPAQILMTAVNAWRGLPTNLTPQDAVQNQISQILLGDGVTSRESWQALAAQHVGPLFAQQSLPCFGKLEKVDGQYVSTLYTEATDGSLTVDDIKEILDPRNWSMCCKFFYDVKEQQAPYTERGWSRILESISPEPEKWQLRTALIFFYGDDQAGGCYLNYDLDPHRQDDSGIVEVDKGYIWITPSPDKQTGKTGVKIRTSKQERVQGLSPTATSALGCLLGWGEAAFKLLAGTAEVVVDGKKPAGFAIHPFVLTSRNHPESEVDHGPHHSSDSDKPAKLPPNFGTAVTDARDLLDDLINRTRDVGADAASRWMDGVTRNDVKAITDNIARNLSEFALTVYDAAEDSVKPEESKTAEGQQ